MSPTPAFVLLPWLLGLLVGRIMYPRDLRLDLFWKLSLALSAAMALSWAAYRAIARRRAPAPVAVTVGPEGVVIHDRYRGPELITLARISHVRASGRAIEIRIRRQGLTSLPLQDEAAAQRLEALYDDFRNIETKTEPALKVVERAGPAHTSMVDQLTAAATGGQYRGDPITADDLADLVVSPEAQPRFRIAAAAALERVDESRAKRIASEVGEATINEPLRIALQELDNDDILEQQITEAERWHGTS